MVERTVSEGFDTFTGVVESIEVVSDGQKEGGKQYHIVIEPIDVEVGGKTQRIHEWIRISQKATESSIPEGSALDKYLNELELINKDLKKCVMHEEVIKWMLNKKFRFVKRKLGKSFQGHEAKDYWTPNALLQ